MISIFGILVLTILVLVFVELDAAFPATPAAIWVLYGMAVTVTLVALWLGLNA